MERATVSLVAAAVSPIIIKLCNKASSYFGGDITLEELQNLETVILPKIRTVVEAAERIRADSLRPWLMKLKAAAYEAEDVLDEYEYENIKHKVSPLPTPLIKFQGKAKAFFAPVSLKTALKKSIMKLQQSANEASELIPLIDIVCGTTARTGVGNQRHATVSLPSLKVFGRDEERDSLIRLLINEPHVSSSSSTGNSVPVHAICGLAGAGKTTLAQCIYNHPRVASRYYTRMWVHVSRNFDVHRVTREIMESAAQDGCSPIGNLDVLQMKIKEKLESKVVLLVLDDIWCEDREQWDQLLVPFNEVGEGSKILITTRMERVASKLGVKSIIHLKELKAEDCWSIVKHYAFGDANKVLEDPELEHIGKQIVDRLKNSPLSARVVGSSLGQKVSVDEWKMFLKDDMLRDTMDTLLSSFHYLTPHLQRCFAFCSLYPKGFFFHDLHEMVRLWIAQGFVETPCSTQMTIEDKGRQYFNDLLSYSFFQYDSFRRTYKIHDLLHDLAEEVSKDHYFRIEGDMTVSVPKSILHLSIVTDKLATYIPDILKLVNLRTFIVFSTSEVEFNIFIDKKRVFEKLTKLRVVHLGSNSILELNSSVGQLKLLRYLQLRGVKKLPETLSRLYCLQFLVLENSFIERVPKSFNNLVNLGSVLGSNVDHIFSMVPTIGKLTSLQTLKTYHAKTMRQYGIGQLKNLQQLRGSLHICDLQNVKDKTEAMEAMLKDKAHLDELKLEWGNSTEGDLVAADEEVLEGLEPPPNLKRLEICHYAGVMSPIWMLNDHFISNLQHLVLSFCHNLAKVPCLPCRLKSFCITDCFSLVEVPSLPHSLSELRVYRCPELLQLSPFPCSLEVLYVTDCLGIQNLLSSLTYDDEEEQQHLKENCSHQPLSLKRLSIHGCSVLEEKTLYASLQKFDSLCDLWLSGLPSITSFLFSCNLTALKALYIYDCENLRSIKGIGSLLLQDLEITRCPELTMISSNMRPNGEDDGVLPSPLPFLPELGMYRYPFLSTLMFSPMQLHHGHSILPSSLTSLKIEESGQMDRNLWERLLLGLTSLYRLTICRSSSLPNMCHLFALQRLSIRDCPELTWAGNLLPLISLQELEVSRCPKLITGEGESSGRLSSIKGKLAIDELLLPAVLLQEQGLNFLKKLKIEYCSQDIPFSTEQEDMFQHLASLRSLCFENCSYIPALPLSLEKLSSLEELEIAHCDRIKSLPNLPTSLKSLNISFCDKIKSLPDLPPSLESLDIWSCDKMELLHNLPSSLESLYISSCPKLRSLPNLPVSFLDIRDCPLMKSLPHLHNSLKSLNIIDCHPQLMVKYKKEGTLLKRIG